MAENEIKILNGRTICDKAGRQNLINYKNEVTAQFNTIAQDFSSQIKEKANDVLNRFEAIMGDKKFIAHRGLSYVFPEHTIYGYQKCCELGMIIKMDVHETKDGKFVIIHDDTVDRTTNGTGKVTELTLEQIKSFDIDAGTKIELYPPMKVMTVEEGFEIVKKYNVPVMFDVKYPLNYQNLFNIVKKYNMQDKIFISSYYISCLKGMQNVYSKLPIVIHLETPTTQDIDNMAQYQNAGVNLNLNVVTKEVVDYARENNVKVFGFYSDTNKNLKRGIELGVDCFVSPRIIQGGIN